jgi:membrane protease YdiL (CAAX protease family)
MTNHNITKKNPAWAKVTVYFLVIISAQYLASRVPVLDSMFYYFVIALVLSYLMLRAEHCSLLGLGFVPANASDWKNFFSGLGIGIIALLISAGITIWLNNGRLELTGRIDPVYLLILILINLWSAFAQEFAYRGYPFQKLLKSYGPWIGQFAITLPFAVMHMKLDLPFTAQQFLTLWLTTGLGSILYGLCYIKTGKLLLSIGLHLGWNLAQLLVPRSPTESKTVLFNLLQSEKDYHTLNVLLPYVGVTLVTMALVWWWNRTASHRKTP